MASVARAPMRHVVAAGGFAVLGAVWYVVYATTGFGPTAAGYVIMPVGCLVAAAAVRHMLSALPLEPVARRFWRGLLAAFLLFTAGWSVIAVNAARYTTGGLPPRMSIAGAVLIGAGFVVAMIAFARVPTGAWEPSVRNRVLLDRVITFAGAGGTLWHFVLAPMLWAPQRWSIQSMIVIMLALVLALGALTKIAYLGESPVDRLAMRLIAGVGLVAAGVAALAITAGRSGGIPAQALVMPLAPVLFTLAVRAQWRGRRTGPSAQRFAESLPYLAAAGVIIPCVSVAVGDGHPETRLVLAAAVVVGSLIMVRHFISSRDNAALLRDIRGQEVRLQHEVTHDGLTGLANRALFHDRLATALRSRTGATVLLLDLDDFKTVNDSLGHDVGDELLVAVADALRGAVGPGGLPVRVGGDEFAVLLDGGADGEELAERILDELSRPLSAHRLLVQASIGIASHGSGDSVDDVLRAADVAMYAAKQRGKAGFVRYTAGMEEPVLAHIQLGGELRRALDDGEFRVFYQPIMTLADRRVCGVEALVRWQHPTRGLVPPAEFIPAAERTGLIVPLGRWVLRETFRQTAEWLAAFGPDALQKAAPNVSARQLRDPDFVSDVIAALNDSGLSCDRVVLEVTESAVLRGRQVSRSLHELDAMGIKLALDDFGTGESSLSLLRSFPAAIVKLDKSFVDGIEIDDGNAAAADARQAVARAVNQLAGALRLDTVAEGIENEQQAQRLMELGYSLGQGYHLARPMCAEDMTRLLAKQQSVVAAN